MEIGDTIYVIAGPDGSVAVDGESQCFGDRKQLEADLSHEVLGPYLRNLNGPDLRVARCQLIGEREMAVLEALPKTADGVPIYPGMRVFPELLNDDHDDLDEGGIVVSIDDEGEIVIRDTQGEKGPHLIEAHASNVFSTRAAALAAAKD